MTILWQPTYLALQNAMSGLASIQVTNPGGGYTSPPTITIDEPSPGGIQATALAVMGVGSVSVTAGGQYGATPIVVASPPVFGTQAVCYAVLTPFTVQSVNMVRPGNGYLKPPTVLFSGGGGSGAAAQANLTGGEMVAINLLNGGSRYTSVPTINLVSSSGIGAEAAALISTTGAVTAIGTITPGSGYTSAPTLTLTGTGTPTGTVLTASISGGITLPIYTGPGYSYDNGQGSHNAGMDGYTGQELNGGTPPPPIVSIDPPDQPGGTQALVTATIQGSGASWGFVFSMVEPGSGYSYAPGVHISAPDDPTLPEANQGTATTKLNAEVVAINILNGGDGGSVAEYPITFSGGGGTGAAAGAYVLDTTVTGIVITSQGTGYVTPPVVQFIGGGGSGASATAVTTPVGVTSYSLTNPGQGYTSAPTVKVVGGSPVGPIVYGTADLTNIDLYGSTGLAGGTLSGLTLTIAADKPAGNPGTTLTFNGTTTSFDVLSLLNAIADTFGLTVQDDAGVGPILIDTNTGDGASIDIISGTAVTALGLTTGTTYGNMAVASVTMAPTTVDHIVVDATGSGYFAPPKISFAGGSGQGAEATASLEVASVLMTVPFGNPGYLYETVPNVTFSGTPGTGAAGTAILSYGEGDPFTLEQASALLVSLGLVGQEYSAGQTVLSEVVKTTRYVAPAQVSWTEVDRATRFVGTVLPETAWVIAPMEYFAWPVSWDMSPSSDPTLVWTARVSYLSGYWFNYLTSEQRSVAIAEHPFIEEVWLPLVGNPGSLASAAWQYYIATAQAPAQGTTVTVAYDDNSPLAIELLALMGQAQALTNFLTTD